MTLDGRSGRLATVGSGRGPKVGRYVVHLGEFEAVAVPQLDPADAADLLIIDEIGKMECLSPAFVETARRALAGTIPVLGTVALAGGGFIAEAKHAPNVELVVISRENRDLLAEELAQRLERELHPGNQT